MLFFFPQLVLFNQGSATSPAGGGHDSLFLPFFIFFFSSFDLSSLIGKYFVPPSGDVADTRIKQAKETAPKPWPHSYQHGQRGRMHENSCVPTPGIEPRGRH